MSIESSAMTKKLLQTISPIDGSIYVERPYACDQVIATTLEHAKRGQAALHAMTLEERQSICLRALALLEQDRDAIADEITHQMGRPIAHSAGEISGVLERARHMIEIAEEALADTTPISTQASTSAKNSAAKRLIKREPLGTVFIVAPWNYPLLTMTNALFPAILAGNSVIVKPSAQTPLSAERFIDAFRAAGLPTHAAQLLNLSHQQTEQVILSGDIDFLCFTGSVEGGRSLAKLAASKLIGAGLELGGKDPAYVRADADLAFSIEQLVDGAFFNAGQSCCGIERIYVNDALYDQFVDGYTETVMQYRLGNPLDRETNLGPMVRTSAADWVKEQSRAAIKSGARNTIPAGHFTDDAENSPYLAPKVFVDVDHSMSIMRDESFGPVVGIMPVRDDEQAVQLMNDSNLGLTASIWTQDLDRAETLGDTIQTGTVFMNRCDYLDPALAWTGVKETGLGITLSALGFHQLTRAKSYYLSSGS